MDQNKKNQHYIEDFIFFNKIKYMIYSYFCVNIINR